MTTEIVFTIVGSHCLSLSTPHKTMGKMKPPIIHHSAVANMAPIKTANAISLLFELLFIA